MTIPTTILCFLAVLFFQSSAQAMHLGFPLKANISNQLIIAMESENTLIPLIDDRLKAQVPQIEFEQEFLFKRRIASTQKSRSYWRRLILLTFKSREEAEAYGEKIQHDPHVLWVAPNYLIEGDPRERTQDDDEDEDQEAVVPKGDDELYHQVIQSKEAWEVTQGSGVVIAVTDDGIDSTHPDLLDSLWINSGEIPGNQIDDDQNGFIDDTHGWNFSDGNPLFQQGKDNHGTFVSGLINASRDGQGITGTAPDAKIMGLKFIGGKIPWSSAQVARTYAYAIKNGAKIISTSYNVDTMINDQLYLEAVRFAYDAGALIFNSAGNSRDNQPERVAVHELLLIAATDIEPRYRDQRCHFSNFGRGIDFSAPGNHLVSTIRKGQYEENSGTSFSTPIVAAGAAIIWSAFPHYNRDQVWARLTALSDDIDPRHIPYYQGKMGIGRINLHKALSQDVPPPRIRGLEQIIESDDIAPIEELQLNLKNVFSPHFSNFRKASQLLHLESGKILSPVAITPYRLGTNVIRFRFTEVLPLGHYIFTLKADELRDPFDQSLDGNSDGLEGSDWVLNFSVTAKGKEVSYDE